MKYTRLATSTEGLLDLVRCTESDGTHIAGDLYLHEASDEWDSFTGPLSQEQVNAFYILFEQPS